MSTILGIMLLFFFFFPQVLPLGGGVPVAQAQTECEQPEQRFRGGHGRRPGTTVVVVTPQYEIQDEEGQFISASGQGNELSLQGDEVTVRLRVRNDSLYEIGSVVLKHGIESDSARFEGVGSVTGAVYDPAEGAFTIDRIPSEGVATVLFRLLFREDLPEELIQSKVTLTDYIVLEAARRFPVRTSESPVERARQQVERVGIGTVEVVCFMGETQMQSIFSRPPRTSRIVPRLITEPLPLPAESTGLIRNLSVTKRASRSEVQPGSDLAYTITVRNGSVMELRDLLVNDRFSSDDLLVIDAGGGYSSVSGLQWVIEELSAGDSWVTEYRARVSNGAHVGEFIPNTVTLASNALLDAPTVSASAEVRVMGEKIMMPQTGVDQFDVIVKVFLSILGTVIACSLYAGGAVAIFRRV